MTAARVAAPTPRPLRMAPQSRGLAHAFVADQLPAALQPQPNDRLFQVALLWQGKQLIDVARFEPAGKVGPKELPLAGGLLPRSLVPRAQTLPGGDVALLLPTDTVVRIARGETTVSPDELFAAREAEPIEVPFRGLRYVLKLEERVVITSDALQLVGRYLRPEPVQRRALQDRIDPIFLSMIAIGAIVMAFVLGLFRLTLQNDTTLADDPLTKNRPVFTTHLPPPPPVIEKKQPRLAAGGPAGKVGDPKANKPKGGEAGGPKSKHPPALGANVTSFFAALDQAAAASVVLSGSGNGKMKDAIGDLKNSAEAAAGPGGWTTKGDGPGGGGKNLDVHQIGSPEGVPDGTGLEVTLKGKPRTVFQPGVIHVDGDLIPKDVVGRIIRNHWNEIRYCYEKELAKDPNLAGKVAMRFQIGPIGAVITTEVSETSLQNPAAEQCITSSVRRWVFPAPKGGGIVEVQYPFMFESTK